jgi:hypothetical protein
MDSAQNCDSLTSHVIEATLCSFYSYLRESYETQRSLFFGRLVVDQLLQELTSIMEPCLYHPTCDNVFR